MSRKLALATLLLATAAARPAAASPEEIFGYGPRVPAMGAGGAASARGFEAAVANPALLSMLRTNKLTLGLQGASFDLHADGAGLPGRVSYESASGVVIGIDVPLPFGGVLRDRVGVGAAFYTPSDIIVRGRILYPEKPQFVLLPDRAQSLTARAGFGVDFGYGIHAGAGFAVLAEIVGDVTVATDATGRVGTRVEDQLVATYAPTFGAAYELPVKLDADNKLRLGLSYRGRLDARFAVIIDATKLSSLQIPIFNIAGLAQFDPAQISFEAASEWPRTMLVAGLAFKKWSGYPGPLESSIQCPADNPGCGITPPKVEFSDTFVPHAGVEHAVIVTPQQTTKLRAGVRFEPTPLPSQLTASAAFNEATKQPDTVPTRFFDASRLVFSWGAGVELKKPLPPLTIDVWGQYHQLLSKKVESTASDGTVLSSGDASGHVLAGGLIVGVQF